MFSLRTTFARRAPFGSSITTATRTFQSYSPSAAGKESSLNTEGRAEEIETNKNDQLNKQKDGKNQWKDALASDSEAAVKADRGEHKPAADDIKELQKKTADAAQKGQ